MMPGGWFGRLAEKRPPVRTRFNCWNCGRFVWSHFPTMYTCSACDCGWMLDPPKTTARNEDL